MKTLVNQRCKALVRVIAIPVLAAGIMAAGAGPASADEGNLLPILQEVSGMVLHAETGLTNATGNVTGTLESIVFELAQVLRPAA